MYCGNCNEDTNTKGLCVLRVNQNHHFHDLEPMENAKKSPKFFFFENHDSRRKAIDPQLQRNDVQNLLENLRSKERAVPRTLRLKNYISSDVSTQVIDSVLNALIDNEFVEALYIHNFEQGMTDAQIDLLIKVLEKGRIWILNVGENFQVSRDGWTRLSDALQRTNVTHIYLSEHIITKEMKHSIIASVRRNRAKDRRHLDYGRIEMINKIDKCGGILDSERITAGRHTTGCWKCPERDSML